MKVLLVAAVPESFIFQKSSMDFNPWPWNPKAEIMEFHPAIDFSDASNTLRAMSSLPHLQYISTSDAEIKTLCCRPDLITCPCMLFPCL
uniref:Uncharacterized protein n=1 Tax=Arundo donax TaxID=35708 RepID=A0A0A9DAD6_ARUDO